MINVKVLINEGLFCFARSFQVCHCELDTPLTLGFSSLPGGPLVFQGGYHLRKKIHIM